MGQGPGSNLGALCSAQYNHLAPDANLANLHDLHASAWHFR